MTGSGGEAHHHILGYARPLEKEGKPATAEPAKLNLWLAMATAERERSQERGDTRCSPFWLEQGSSLWQLQRSPACRSRFIYCRSHPIANHCLSTDGSLYSRRALWYFRSFVDAEGRG